jgi:hypothetical protein
VHAVLREAAAGAVELEGALQGGEWCPEGFVDLCERARRTGDADRVRALEQLQAVEIRALLGHSLDLALGRAQ